MSETLLAIAGTIVFAITIAGLVMAGPVLMMRSEHELEAQELRDALGVTGDAGVRAQEAVVRRPVET